MTTGLVKNGERVQTVRLKEKFLAHYRTTGNVTSTCNDLKIGRMTVYDWIEKDESFAADFNDAREESTDILEAEARRRGLEGVDEPVFHQGKVCGVVRKYSDRLLENQLKANRPEKYRERTQTDLTGTVTGLIGTMSADRVAEIIEEATAKQQELLLDATSRTT